MSAVLEMSNATCKLGTELVVAVERMELRSGDVAVLNAPSGWGKSTVLGLAGGVIAPTNSDAVIRVLGAAVGSDRQINAAPNRLGFVLQTHGLLPFLTLQQNIVLPLDIGGIIRDQSWIDFVINTLGITGLLDRKPSQVSQGQRQRAGIARAFVAKPSLLLLDEPVSALDATNAMRVEELIALLAEDMNAAVLMASHRVHGGAFASARAVRHVLDDSTDPAVITFGVMPGAATATGTFGGA